MLAIELSSHRRLLTRRITKQHGQWVLARKNKVMIITEVNDCDGTPYVVLGEEDGFGHYFKSIEKYVEPLPEDLFTI